MGFQSACLKPGRPFSAVNCRGSCCSVMSAPSWCKLGPEGYGLRVGSLPPPPPNRGTPRPSVEERHDLACSRYSIVTLYCHPRTEGWPLVVSSMLVACHRCWFEVETLEKGFKTLGDVGLLGVPGQPGLHTLQNTLLGAWSVLDL